MVGSIVMICASVRQTVTLRDCGQTAERIELINGTDFTFAKRYRVLGGVPLPYFGGN
ncbi:hypothetical protein RN2511_049730 [Rhodococcus sp. NKCM2511]|nr:hypothetical protein RN2511_049730 [Rhodococcus sp. NKCM2511]